MNPISEVKNMDCMIGMPEFPDKFFDLAIVDPPYGLGDKLLKGGKTGRVKFHEMYELNQWDNSIPDASYFDELFRISQNQIIWGANYFWDHLPATRGIICWDKQKGDVYNFSHFELAWTSFDQIARLFPYSNNNGFLTKSQKIHPTQKPVALYKWLLQNYAKPNDKILDTHLGSQSSRIAAYKLGFDFWGYEIDADYFKQGCERFEKAIAQPLFDEPKYEQAKLI